MSNLRKKLGEQAYFTMRDVWNPKIAAKRIIAASEKLLNNEEISTMYDDGPCSKAKNRVSNMRNDYENF